MTAGYLPTMKPDDEANQRYTTPALLAWCASKAGVDAFDLDVAACEEAHCAPRWIDRERDGLNPATPWDGQRIWVNPPWSDIAPWVDRAWFEMGRAANRVERIAMLLPGNRQEQPWWQRHIEPFRDLMDRSPMLLTHYPAKRQPFGVPGNPTAVGINGVPHPVVLLVWRRT